MIRKFINKLHIYKKYKGEIYRVCLFHKDTGRIFSVKTDLDLDNSILLSIYRNTLKKDNIDIHSISKEKIPTFTTRIILFLECLFLGYCAY
jgi:hypothetical protein